MEDNVVLDTKKKNDIGKKYVPPIEAALFVLGVFFLASLTGVVNNYRFKFLNDIVFIELPAEIRSQRISLITTIFQIMEYAMSFLFIFIIDRTKTKYGRFRPYGMIFAIPAFLASVFMFWYPQALTYTGLMVYFIAINIIYAIGNTFCNSTKSISNLITPNNKERTMLITWRDILSAIGNSAPLLFFLIFESMYKKGILFKDISQVYLGTAIIFGIVGATILLTSMIKVRERVECPDKKTNPFLGIKDVLSSRNYLVIGFSELIKNIRGLAQYTGIYLAAALLGSTGKYLLLGLPTAIGTFVGMIIIKLLLKKFSNRTLYIASGMYSLVANIIAFGVGYWYFVTGYAILQIVFIVTLFLIGLQFGASNLLPSIFNADVLDELELKTGKRLDATLGFANSTFSRVTAITATALAPFLMNIYIGVKPDDANAVIDNTIGSADFVMKVKLLGCYTLIQGVCMLLCGLPFFAYKLVGDEKERIMEELRIVRENKQKEKDICDCQYSVD